MLITLQATINGNTITYFRNTADQYKWYASLVKDIGNDNTVIKVKANEIVQGKTTDMDKIKSIYFWVSAKYPLSSLLKTVLPVSVRRRPRKCCVRNMAIARVWPTHQSV